MSELRVALVAEGPTDAIVIKAALRALLPRPFTLAVLQPEATQPRMGAGWCGVLKWCRAFAGRGAGSNLETDPTLPGFDLFVIHLDADVADRSYADCGNAVAAVADVVPALPCDRPCPPSADAANEIRRRIVAWLGMERLGQRTILCVPSKAIEAWLAAAIFEQAHELLNGIECRGDVEDLLARLPLKQRVKKKQSAYRAHEASVTAHWPSVRARCTQADRFSLDVARIVPTTTPPADDRSTETA